MSRPAVVCLCGSIRFKKEYEQAVHEEELAGRIALTIGFYELSLEEKKRVDELHLERIFIADEILVIDVDGYIGESTRSEIKYAIRLNRRIRYWSKEREAADGTD